jgi:uncharacterized protein YybS (DUF2232 family)
MPQLCTNDTTTLSCQYKKTEHSLEPLIFFSVVLGIKQSTSKPCACFLVSSLSTLSYVDYLFPISNSLTPIFPIYAGLTFSGLLCQSNLLM